MLKTFTNPKLSTLVVLIASSTLVPFMGCKKAPVDDATLATSVHTALTSDGSISSEPIQSAVVNGVVTLTGNVSSDTARLVAAQDAAKVSGVKEVVNSLSIAGVAITPEITSAAAPAQPRYATPAERKSIARNEPLLPPQTYSTPAPPPPAPVFRTLSVPAGTRISVRVTQSLSSETATDGQPFSGVVTSSVVVDGEIAIPAGTGVTGRVISAHDAGHYSGNSRLSVELTGLSRRKEQIAISTEPYSLEGKGRGVNTAEKVGGGAAIGAVLGGIFGGGKGAAIGAAAGGGGGAVVNGVTRGQQVVIPSETVVAFRLTSGISVRSVGPADTYSDSSGLQTRQP